MSNVPVTITDEGYVDIAGLRQATAVNVKKESDSLYVVTVTLQGDKTLTVEIMLGADGYPLYITVDGQDPVPFTWQGFGEIKNTVIFNGIELPALPKEWDREKYPYAWISHTQNLTTGVVNDRFCLYVYDEVYPLECRETMDGDQSVRPTHEAAGIMYECSHSDPAAGWVEEDRDEGDDSTFIIVTTWTENNGDQFRQGPLWSNFDIVNPDDDFVYLAASDEPAPIVDHLVLEDFLDGLVMGLVQPQRPISKRQPIAYSYNGVILPALPEWDREAYPYAYIAVGAENPAYRSFEVYSEPFVVKGEYVCIESDFSWKTWVWKPDSTVWKSDYVGNHEASYNWCYTTDLIWANTDILSKDGSVYLAASEPVPVYE